MSQFCEHYIPNNSDYFRPGYCCLLDKICKYRGNYPEYDSKNAECQQNCEFYKEWVDPLRVERVKDEHS